MKGTRETRRSRLGSQKLCLHQGRQRKMGKKASQQEGLAKGSSGSRPLRQLWAEGAQEVQGCIPVSLGGAPIKPQAESCLCSLWLQPEK